MESHGKAKTNSKCHTENAGGRLGVVEGESGKHGVNSDEVPNSNSPRRNSDRSKSSNTELSNVGGIFRQLKDLRELHLAQVKEDDEVLTKRLSSNEVYKKQVLQGIEEIEARLQELDLSDKPS